MQKLALRQNEISLIENISHLTGLRSLDLYENKIEDPSSVSGLLPSLTYLDLSFNHIRSLDNKPLCNLPNLSELYFVSNKVRFLSIVVSVMVCIVYSRQSV